MALSSGVPDNPLLLFGANLVGWWNMKVGVTTSSGNVTVVADQSGNGRDLTNTNTVPYNATGFNGAPTASFLTANSAYLAATSVPMGTGAVGACFMVGQMLSGTSNFGGAVVYGGTGDDHGSLGNAAFITRQATSNGFETKSDGFLTAVLDDAISLTTNYRLGVVFDASNGTHYVNNVAGTSAPVTGITPAWTNNGTLVVGNRFLGGVPVTSNPWEGPISEIVLVKSDITSQLTALDNWFKYNWGL
jgi:hypothetical protein